ncbi:YcaO-like family protein [Streptomyces sp. NPDC015127]|uniref:YcaO-like family protein n=1 Tax=Streptomyces sp. NPDC015127 TaxID=3364939 RepID=UPI0036FA3249
MTVIPQGKMSIAPSTERSFSLFEAAQLAEKALQKLGLRPELRDAGNGADPTAWLCILRDSEGRCPPRGGGLGKGSREESRVGAIFEAIEHVLTGPLQFPFQHAEMKSAIDVAEQIRDEASSQILADAGREPIACLPYSSISGNRTLWAPAYLSCPWYVDPSEDRYRNYLGDSTDYRQLMRYTSNSGHAIGATKIEAIVHALNEAIERDALSLLIIRAFMTKTSRLRVVDPDTLPADLRNILTKVQNHTSRPIHLIEMTTDIGVPSFCAYLKPSNAKPAEWGAGTSLSPHYAIRRALTELLQCLLFEGQMEPVDRVDRVARMRIWPILHTCAAMDLTRNLQEALARDYEDREAPNTPEEHLRELIRLLERKNLTPYWRDIRTLENGISAGHILVPGLERFMLITSGGVILPGPRGKNARLNMMDQ